MDILRKISPFYMFIFILLFFCFSFLFQTDNSFDQDLGRHLKTGEIIITSKAVPKTNLYSYTYPNFPFINHHYLFEVFAYLWTRVLEINSLLILKLVVLLTAVFITLYQIPRINYPLMLPLSFIFLHILRERTELRPEIFSFLFTSLSLLILNKFFKTSTKLIFLLPIIGLIWVNTHIYFPLIIFLELIFIIPLYFTKKWIKLKLLSILTLISIFILLLNPNGISGALYPFTVFGNYGYTIVENQNIFLMESIGFSDPNFLFVKISILITLFSIIRGFFKGTLSLINLLLCSVGVAFALMNIRSFPYLFFISLPSVVENLGFKKVTNLTKILAILTLFFIIIESIFYLNGLYYKYTDSDKKPILEFTENAKDALTFVMQNRLTDQVFNNFDIGSYIIYRGYPQIKVFVDGRPESYPKDFFLDVYIPSQYNYEKFKDLNNKYNFQTIIFSHTDQTPWAKNFLKSIISNKDWDIIYLDSFMIVLVKKDINHKNLKIIELKDLDPNKYNFDNHLPYLRIALFLENYGYNNTAIKFTDKALKIFPESKIGNSLLLSLLSQKKAIPDDFAKYLENTKNLIFW